MTAAAEFGKTVRHVFTCAALVITAWQAPIVPLGILAAALYVLKTAPPENEP